jgi:serine/threonine protein phosphatase PrpC
MCDKLIALANSRGGPDNITVLIARVSGEGLAPARVGAELARRVYADDET